MFEREVKDTWMELDTVWELMGEDMTEDDLDEVLRIIALAIVDNRSVLWGSELEVMLLNEWLADSRELRYDPLYLVVVTPGTRVKDVGMQLTSSCDACTMVGVLFKNGAHYQYGQTRGQTLFNVALFTDGGGTYGGGARTYTSMVAMAVLTLVVGALPR